MISMKGGMTASAGLVSTVPGYVINMYLMTFAVARRVFGKANFGFRSIDLILVGSDFVRLCFLLLAKRY